MKKAKGKLLYLYRHAKSSWDDPSLPDFDRPLGKRGLKIAPLMGKFMKKQGVDPDLIICSPARRAMQTLELSMPKAGIDCDIELREDIYEASGNNLKKCILQIDDRFKTVMLVGHNPGMEELIEMLTGAAEPFPTAALARIKLGINAWSQAKERCGTLEALFRPKELDL